jgi:integrase
MAKVNLYLRDPQSSGPSPIVIFVRWDRITLKYPSGESILPRHWSAKAQAARSSLPMQQTFNLNLRDKVNRILTAYQQFLLDNDQRTPTRTELRARIDAVLNPAPVKPKDSLTGYLDKHIERTEVRMQAGELQGNARLSQFRTLRSHLLAFAKDKRQRLDFDAMDKDFYTRFMAYLTKDKAMAKNTVGKYVRTLKTVLNAAQDEQPDLLPQYRSRQFKAPAELTDKVYLTAAELNDLYAFDLSKSPRLERVRDVFIIGAWTGLRFSDWSKLTPDNIDGDRLRITTQKTQQQVTVPLHSCVRAILLKYGQQLPRIPTNQKVNEYLKEITALVPSLQVKVHGRPKAEQVSTHTARRSFASNAVKGDGYTQPVPARSIMAITGHKKEADFRAYVRLDADEHAEQFAQYMPKVASLAIVA